MDFKNYIDLEGWQKVENLDEGIGSTFKKIINSIGDIVNVKYVKEKVIDGINTLLMKIEGSLYPEDIDDLEDKYPNYFFDQDRKNQIIQVHEE